jgi:ankyrin repeat protein
MNIRAFLRRLSHSLITRLAIVTLIAPACSTPVFCGEIHDAAQARDLATVKALLKKNPNLVLSKDNFGWTPLHYAALQGHRDVAKLLLANKADAMTNDGHTPLHVASQEDNKDVVELLRQNGGHE